MTVLSFASELYRRELGEGAAVSATTKNRLTAAWYSDDPYSISPFHAFDPDSFFVYSAFYDSLGHIDIVGKVAPSLATHWEQSSPTCWDLELRRDVRFSDGSIFNANDVVATFAGHFTPTPSIMGRSMLAPIQCISKLDDYRVRVETKHPDPMLMRRLSMMPIVPHRVLSTTGRDSLIDTPIGTGAYRLESWEKGKGLLLSRNPEHWADRASIDEIHLPILRRTLWLDYLRDGKIDVALNLDSQDLEELEGSGIQVLNQAAALARWFMLRYRGPLADSRVRQALNCAVHSPLILDVVNRGFGAAQRSV
ncbi:MAG: ABC transporter substrate-binding protein, partial [Planctomycetota bacterium]